MPYLACGVSLLREEGDLRALRGCCLPAGAVYPAHDVAALAASHHPTAPPRDAVGDPAPARAGVSLQLLARRLGPSVHRRAMGSGADCPPRFHRAAGPPAPVDRGTFWADHACGPRCAGG